MIYLICKKCKTKVTAILEEQISDATWKEYSTMCERDFVGSGAYFKDPDENFILNLKDQRNLNQHPELRRSIGCCGPSDSEVPNLVCRCFSEIGREVSDCITPHFVRILAKKVEIVEDKWMAMGFLSALERQEPGHARLLEFYQLVQYGSEVEVREFVDQHFR